MRRLQRLWGSVSVLTAAVLAGICFLRGSRQRIFLVGVFALWIAYSFAVFLMPVIKRYKYRRNLRKIRKKPQNHSGSNGAELQRLYYLLLCNANHRITGYIKSIYPEAVWKWETAAPEKVITEGETGRIRLFNVDDYNFADISFDNSANIECTFLKAVSFRSAAQTECRDETAENPKNETDPLVWFEKNGRVILKNLIADLSSRGHNTLTVRDDGSCVVEQGDKTVEVSHLTDFPERVYYPRLINVLAGAGIAAKSVDNGLAVSW